MATHAETQLGACSMDEEVNDAWYAMREAQEKLQRVIDELMTEGSRYTLEVLAEANSLHLIAEQPVDDDDESALAASDGGAT